MIPESLHQLAQANEREPQTQEALRQALTQRIAKLRQQTLARLDIYDEKLAQGEFEDQEGEEPGSGEARKLRLQGELSRADHRLDSLQATLDSGEELPQEPELDLEALNEQYQDDLKIFGTPETGFTPTLIKPEDQDYETLKTDIDKTKFGEYTLNPETQALDFEQAKIFIPDLSAYNGKPRSEVFQYITDTYANTHHLPGVEYWHWLEKNPDKTPDILKDKSSWFYFPGSLLRDSYGSWCVPYAYWNGSAWHRSAGWLGSAWGADDRVVLLEI